jgi:hypothetical protein
MPRHGDGIAHNGDERGEGDHALRSNEIHAECRRWAFSSIQPKGADDSNDGGDAGNSYTEGPDRVVGIFTKRDYAAKAWCVLREIERPVEKESES